MNAQVEHLNLTVKDPAKIAQHLTRIFDWEIRWSGPSKDTGTTIHVGTPDNAGTYVALYTHDSLSHSQPRDHLEPANLNHIGIVVDNLESIERRVLSQGFKTHNHADYAHGRRFYFDISEELEVEVISYL